MLVVSNGTAQATIVISATASESLRAAAAQLQKYVEKASGALSSAHLARSLEALR